VFSVDDNLPDHFYES